jgi:hypothetical protein
MRWLGLVLFAALPLQWFVVGGTPLGQMRLHQAVLLILAAVIIAARPLSATRPVIAVALPFIALNILMITSWMAVSLYNGQIPRSAVQVLLYLGVFIAVGTYIGRAATGEEPGALTLLRWAATAAVVALIAAFALSMIGNGINPLSVVQRTIASADPEVLQKELFRSSFVGYGYDAETVRGNIRHEVFGAILAAMYVSVWAEGLVPGSGARRNIRRAALVVGTLLLLISMSRAILLAAAIWPLLSLWRSVRLSEVTRRQVTLVVSAGLLLVGLVISGVGRVVWVRFTQDTSSYESRGGLYDQAFQNIGENFWTGGIGTEGESSHNFVVDAWLRGGVVVAVLAAAILLVLLWSWARSVVCMPFEPIWMLPVAAAFALPIDRMLTAGGGLIPPVGWVTLGFIAGAFVYQRSLGPPADDVPRVSQTPVPAG